MGNEVIRRSPETRFETQRVQVPSGKVRSGQPVLYLHHKLLGTVSHVTGLTEDVVEQYECLPYGATEFKDGQGNDIGSYSAIGLPFVYTGREFDAETELYHYRMRAYDPACGRFLQRDPLGPVDGPNLFAYARSCPTATCDPLGLFDPFGWIGNAAEDVVDAAGDFVEGAADVLVDIAEGAADVAEGAADVAVDIAEGAADVAVDIAEGAADVAVDVAEGAAELAEGVADVAEDAAEGVAEGAEEGLDFLSEVHINIYVDWWPGKSAMALWPFFIFYNDLKPTRTYYSSALGGRITVEGHEQGHLQHGWACPPLFFILGVWSAGDALIDPKNHHKLPIERCADVLGGK